MANEEAMRLSILLTLKDGASDGVASFISVLKQLDSQGKLSIKTLERVRAELNKKIKLGSFTGDDKLLSDLKKISKGTKGVGKDFDSLKNKISRGLGSGVKLGFEGAVVRGLKSIDSQATITQQSLAKVRSQINRRLSETGPESLTDAGRPYRDQPRRSVRDPYAQPLSTVERVGEKVGTFHDRYVDPTQQITTALRQGFRDAGDITKTFTEPAMKAGRAQAQFMVMDRGASENAKAFKIVSDSVKADGLVTRAEGLGILTDLVNTLGNVDKASQVYGLASKYSFGAQSIYGHSEEQTQKSLQNAFKSLEMMGKTSVPDMTRSFDMMVKVSSSTGGRISGEDFLAFAQKGRSSARDLSDTGILDLASLFPEMGASATGTALTTASRAIVGGSMRQSARNRWKHFGMLEDGKYTTNSLGGVKTMEPGAISGSDVFQKDPMAFADKLRDQMISKGVQIQYDAEGNLTDDSRVEVTKELKSLFQDRTAEGLMNSLMTQRGSVLKEREAALKAMGIDKAHDVALTSDAGKALKFEKSWENFKTDTGGPVLEAMTSLMSTAKPLLDLMGQFPGVTSKVVLGLAGLKIASSITESFSIMNRVMETSRGNLIATGGAAQSTAGKVGGLRGKLSGLPSMIKIGISLAALDFTWEAIQLMLDASKKQKELDSGKQTTVKDRNALYNTPAPTKKERENLLDKGPAQAKILNQLLDQMHDPKLLAADTWKTLEGGTQTISKSLGTVPQNSTDRWSMILRYLMGEGSSGTLFKDPLKRTDPKYKQWWDDLYPKYAKKPELANAKIPAPIGLNAFLPGISLLPDRGAVGRRVQQDISGANFFQKNAATLQNPQVMTSFRRDVMPTMNLGPEMKERVENMLRLAFPESFATSTQQLAQTLQTSATALTPFQQALMTLPVPTTSTATSFSLLSPTMALTPQQFTDLGDPLGQTQTNLVALWNAAQPLPPPLFGLRDSANAAKGSLDGLVAKIDSFQMPTLPGYTANSPVPGIPGAPGAQGKAPGLKPSIFVNPPPFAVGGDLTQTGLAVVHTKEQIVPARAVTFRDRLSQSMVSTANVLEKQVQRPFYERTPESFANLRFGKDEKNTSLEPRDERESNASMVLPRPQKPSSISLNYNPTININISDGGSKSDPKQVQEEFKAALFEHSREIERIVTQAMNDGRKWA